MESCEQPNKTGIVKLLNGRWGLWKPGADLLKRCRIVACQRSGNKKRTTEADLFRAVYEDYVQGISVFLAFHKQDHIVPKQLKWSPVWHVISFFEVVMFFFFFVFFCWVEVLTFPSRNSACSSLACHCCSISSTVGIYLERLFFFFFFFLLKEAITSRIFTELSSRCAIVTTGWHLHLTPNPQPSARRVCVGFICVYRECNYLF